MVHDQLYSLTQSLPYLYNTYDANEEDPKTLFKKADQYKKGTSAAEDQNANTDEARCKHLSLGSYELFNIRLHDGTAAKSIE